MSGKGSAPRPLASDYATYAARWDATFRPRESQSHWTQTTVAVAPVRGTITYSHDSAEPGVDRPPEG